MKKLLNILSRFAIDNFIPTLWSAELLVSLKKVLVYGQPAVVNTDYEGEISSKGDTVKINGIGTVTVGDYTKNSNIGDPEALTDNSRTLTITESKYFNFQVDDIDKAQQNATVMGQAMDEAAYALANTADSFIAGHYTDAAADNLIGSTGTPTAFTAVTEAYEKLVDLSVKLDEANVPTSGRYVVVPPWYEGLMLKDDRFVKAENMNQATLINGQVGRAAGFNVVKSNNVPNTSGTLYRVIAGHPMAISYAEQVNDTEAYRPEKRFADAVKGLHMYGAKVVRPNALAVMTVNRPSL